MRRLLFWSACALLSLPATAPAGAAGPERPNVVFILADDLGWAEPGCYGNGFNETPNIDRLAAEGLRFTHAYAAAPVCSPTRAALMTGQHPARVGITDYLRPDDPKHLADEHVTLAEMFKSRGYATGLVGKWHLTGYASAGAEESPPAGHGFGEVLVSETRGIAAGSYFHPYHFNPDIEKRLEGEEHLVDRCNLEALEFIERHKGEPFFLYLSHYAVHTRLAGKPEKVAKYRAKLGAGQGERPNRNHPHLAAQLESIDEGVGAILKKLEELDLAKQTVVVFTSDNGGEERVTTNAPLRGGKSTLYEGGLRVPLIVRWPGAVPAGRTCDEPVVTTDFYATFRELLGAEIPPSQPLDGVSLVALWKDPSRRLGREALFWHYPLAKPHFLGGVSAGAVRAGDWKLVEDYTTGKAELFNLAEDPGEAKDLSAAEPERAKELREKLRAWRAQVGAAVVKHQEEGQPEKKAEESPPEGTLRTRWAREVTPERVHPEYPRPQMARRDWVNLNGQWEYAIRPKDAGRPEDFDGKILVPFAVESQLSGVQKKVGPENRLWYRRTFAAPQPPPGGRLLLHFGAVDWDATVWVNGKEVGRHKGGYDPFTLDVTDALNEGGPQELVVSVWDPSDAGFQPRGKQVRDPNGIWYTSVTGIWQTVWLEPVPAVWIKGMQLTPDVDRGRLKVRLELGGAPDGGAVSARVEVTDGGRRVASAVGSAAGEIEVRVPNAKLWSPESPFLYGLNVSLTARGGDSVRGYFGMRKIEVAKDGDGFNRLFLNGKPLFQFGPLDQGWWPDGLYTAPTDAALRYDIEVTRRLGFNMARKHVKVEPERWYYWCDVLGLLVWQDMPNGDRHIRPEDPDIERSPESEEVYRREWKAIIDARQNHPCIVAWVPFNEGWGQFKTDEILAWTKEYDPTRLVDGPSGWTDRGSGDMHDMHRYPGPAMPKPEPGRAVVLGEFGGLGLPLEGHLWWNKRNWGYRTYKTPEELRRNYETLIEELRPLISKGLAAAIYTQTTDVEGEVNGLMTYDREAIKFDPERMARLHRRLYEPPPVFESRPVVPTSEESGQRWRYTTERPPEGWAAPDFDDSGWKEGEGGFGTKGTPGTVVRTEWDTGDIWLRRTFELDRTDFANLKLRVHHDEDFEVYLNGERVASRAGYRTDYGEVALDPAAAKLLRRGANTLAVHCKQTGGGQYIDVGLVDVTERPRTASRE